MLFIRLGFNFSRFSQPQCRHISSFKRWNSFRPKFSRAFRSQSHQYRWNREKFTFSDSAGPFCLYAGLIGWFQSITGTQRPKLDDDEIKENIKLAILAIEENKIQEAFDILHATLRLTQHKKNESAENYVIDLMANLYYQQEGNYDEASKLFTDLMRRLMVSGTKQSDPAIIEISLKLADIYARKGDDERAEAGFLFCVDMAKQNVIKSDQEYAKKGLTFKYEKILQDDIQGTERLNDPYALYGMILECYAQFLVTRRRAKESVEYMSKCLEMSNFVHGTGQAHTVVVLNNFGTLCLKYGQYEMAERYLRDACIRAPYVPELTPYLPRFFCNYAETLWHVGRRAEAIDYAQRAVELAEENKDQESANIARAYLRDLKADSARPDKKPERTSK